jgi:exopolysaccharide biosynthesis protein
MVAANQDPDRGKERVPTMPEFADQLHAFGAVHAYALDGGQTAVIVTNDQLMNRPSYGYQRQISDIIYFATAIPDGE